MDMLLFHPLYAAPHKDKWWGVLTLLDKRRVKGFTMSDSNFKVNEKYSIIQYASKTDTTLGQI